jgi:hypothetical protein
VVAGEAVVHLEKQGVLLVVQATQMELSHLHLQLVKETQVAEVEVRLSLAVVVAVVQVEQVILALVEALFPIHQAVLV